VNSLIRGGATTASGLLMLALAACGGDGGGSAEPAGDATPQSGTAAASTIETARTEFGTVLVDSRGMTLYMFDPDKQGQSACDAECLAAWPVVEGPAEAGQGVDGSLLGTAKATDGTTMATYNGWPLYYFVKDAEPGDVTGQAVQDVWWVMSADGRPVRQEPQAAAGGDSAGDDSAGDDAAGDDSGADDAHARAATTVETSRSPFGRILVDSEGMTLYMFDPDERGGSVCDADCLQAWPVAKAPGAAAKGADDSLLGATRATDGTRMVTYNGWPLYYFAQDRRPGDVNGQGAGGVWWVMSPEGRPVRHM